MPDSQPRARMASARSTESSRDQESSIVEVRTSWSRSPPRSPAAVHAPSVARTVRARPSICGTSCDAMETTTGSDRARPGESARRRSCVRTVAAPSNHRTTATMSAPIVAPHARLSA